MMLDYHRSTIMKHTSPEEQGMLEAIKTALMGLLGSSDANVTMDMYSDGDTYLSASKLFVTKSEKEFERLVTGVVLEPNVPDLHGEIVADEEEVYKAMQSFMIHSQSTNIDHIAKSDARVVESWVTREDTQINGVDIVKGTWLMTMQLPEEEFQGVLDGKFTGFSVGCLGEREPILMAKRKYEGKPKNTLKNLSFQSEGAHVALVDQAANGHDLLVIKKENQSRDEILKNLAELLGLPSTEVAVKDDTDEARSILESLANLVSRLLPEEQENTLDTTGQPADPFNQPSGEVAMTTDAPMIEKSTGDDMKPEDIQKAVNEQVEKALAEAKQAHEAEKEELLKAVDALTKAEEARNLAVFKSAVSKFDSLEVAEEEMESLYKFSNAHPEIWKSVLSLCEKAQQSLDNSADLNEVGTSGEGEVNAPRTVGGLPPAVEKKAEALREQDPTLTVPQSIAKALRDKS